MKTTSKIDVHHHIFPKEYANALKYAGPEQIVFGTDLCISKLASIITKNLGKDGDFTDVKYEKMSYQNCLKLFPKLEKFYN